MPESPSARLGLVAISGGDRINQIDDENQAQIAQMETIVAAMEAGTLASRDVTANVRSLYFATDKARAFIAPSTSWIELALAANVRTIGADSTVTANGGDVLLVAEGSTVTLPDTTSSPQPTTVVADSTVTHANPVEVVCPTGSTLLMPNGAPNQNTVTLIGPAQSVTLVRISGSKFAVIATSNLPAWTALGSAYAAGWGDANGHGVTSSRGSSPAYDDGAYRLVADMLEMRGVAWKSSMISVGDKIAVLPDGFRPSSACVSVCMGVDSGPPAMTVEAHPDGGLYISKIDDGNGGTLSRQTVTLGPIRFPVPV